MTISAEQLDAICLQVQESSMGWANGADFEPDRCWCSGCEAKRNEARDTIRLIAAALSPGNSEGITKEQFDDLNRRST